MMLCAIWYHLYNIKNMKNTHGSTFSKVPIILGDRKRGGGGRIEPFFRRFIQEGRRSIGIFVD